MEAVGMRVSCFSSSVPSLHPPDRGLGERLRRLEGRRRDSEQPPAHYGLVSCLSALPVKVQVAVVP
jgi:hypothetical protein